MPYRRGRHADPGRLRARRAAVGTIAGVICVGTLIAGLISRPGPAHPDPPPRAAGRSATAHPDGKAAPSPLALQVMPAPYQLAAPVSRAVVFPDTAAGGGPSLLIVGGLTPELRTTNTVTRLNPVTGQTSQAGHLAAGTHDAAGAVLHGRLFVFGGGSQASTALVQSAPAGAAAGAWTTAGQLPGMRSDLSSVTVHGQAYLLGGYDGTTYYSSVLATPDGRRFRTVARLPVPVRYPAVAALGTRIWVFGGQTAAGITDVIQRVDLSTGTAVVAGRLPSALAHAAAFTLGGRIYIAGGQEARPAARTGLAGTSARLITSRDVLSYHPQGEVSGQVSTAGQLPVPVADAAAGVIGGTGYLIGGEDGGRVVPTVSTLRLVSPGAMTITASAPWLAPARGPGYLEPGSDPSVLPGDILIADHLNNRLLIVDPQGRIRWEFPRPGDLAPGQTFLVPDDAFFSPDGRYIIATQEDDFVISVIDIATDKIVYRYGTPGIPGSGPNQADNPDDAMIAPDGRILFADIKNCRIVTVAPPAHRALRVIGLTTNICLHDPPHRFGSPNGAFPLTDGRYLITEINGDWADEMSLDAQVSWATHPPGVAYPSDTNEVYPGRYLTVDYSDPGQVVEFTSSGRLLWRFGGLNRPSLALPLPNGDILLNDDFNDRVIVIDPAINRIVWQYGHTGIAGSGPGYLHDPDGVDLAPPDSLLITHSATMGLPPGR